MRSTRGRRLLLLLCRGPDDLAFRDLPGVSIDLDTVRSALQAGPCTLHVETT